MKGYTLIEPKIHEELNWDLDLIVKCLEVIRLQLPQILLKDTTEIAYDLIVIDSPHGLSYPGIGIHCDSENKQKFFNDWHEIDERVNHWIEQKGLEFVIKEASNIDYINWKKLISRKYFPERN